MLERPSCCLPAGWCLWPAAAPGAPPPTTTGQTPSRPLLAPCCWQTAVARLLQHALHRPAVAPAWRHCRPTCCCASSSWQRPPCLPGCDLLLQLPAPSPCIASHRPRPGCPGQPCALLPSPELPQAIQLTVALPLACGVCHVCLVCFNSSDLTATVCTARLIPAPCSEPQGPGLGGGVARRSQRPARPPGAAGAPADISEFRHLAQCRRALPVDSFTPSQASPLQSGSKTQSQHKLVDPVLAWAAIAAAGRPQS